MARYTVVPTKTNLIKLRRDRAFTQEGYELLEQKRQILVVELLGFMDKTADIQEKVEKDLSEAFKVLQSAIVVMGRREVSHIPPAVNVVTDITITMRRLMGVNLPVVDIKTKDNPPYFSLGETSFWIDEAVTHFKKILMSLGKLAEMRISLMRIAEEVRKTMRRVNALEKIALPDYNESIKYIEDTLEEGERGMFATLKLVKEGLEKKKE